MSKQRVFMASGQGAKSVEMGMGEELCFHYEESRRVFDLADRLLYWENIWGQSFLRKPLSYYCFYGPAEELQKDTRIAQLASFATSIAHFSAKEEITSEYLKDDIVFSVKDPPQFVAGHSVGLYAALVMAGAITFKTGLFLVLRRGEAMHKASGINPGRMTAILEYRALSDVEELCQDNKVIIANYNSEKELVVSGLLKPMEKFEEKAKKLKIAKKIVSIGTGGAYHSPWMEPAVESLQRAIEEVNSEIKEPSIKVVRNTSDGLIRSAYEVKEELITQVSSPLKWMQGRDRLKYYEGVDSFDEVGHGLVLSGLVAPGISKPTLFKTGVAILGGATIIATSVSLILKGRKKQQ